MMYKTKTKMTLMARAFGLMLMLVAGTMTGYAQSDCFTYADNGKTITGLTDAGKDATSLTIPYTVTLVKSGAFSDASSGLTSLIIDGGNPTFEYSLTNNGDNPTFESGLFGEENTSTLTIIDMGSGMTIANMEALLTSLGTTDNLVTVEIDGYSGDYSGNSAPFMGYSWTNLTSITMPAELITDDQEFGKAKVYGHFPINKELITYCGSATFVDADAGSNMLFYVADGLANDGRLHILRVMYVAVGKGVLIHRTNSSCGYANLLRSDYSFADLIKDEKNTQAITDNGLYEKNMLKGVTTATPIDATSGDKTNYVLKDGAFHPTSRGTIKANRAYLQIPTSLARSESLAISFDDEASGITTTNLSNNTNAVGEWYDLSGRQLSGKPSAKGMYINNGKKYLIK